MRTRVKKVPATTNNLTQAIINFLRSRGHWAGRINNGAVYDPEAKAFRRKRKDDPALADISGVLSPSGVAIWIEVKNAATGDKPKSRQKDFAQEITSRGGYHYFAKRYEDFIVWYNDNIFDNLDKIY
jgi:hypothetical protein